ACAAAPPPMLAPTSDTGRAAAVQIADGGEQVLEERVLRRARRRFAPAPKVDCQDAKIFRRELLRKRAPALLVEGRPVREHDAVAAAHAVGVGEDGAAVGGREGDEARGLGSEARARE